MGKNKEKKIKNPNGSRSSVSCVHLYANTVQLTVQRYSETGNSWKLGQRIGTHVCASASKSANLWKLQKRHKMIKKEKRRHIVGFSTPADLIGLKGNYLTPISSHRGWNIIYIPQAGTTA